MYSKFLNILFLTFIFFIKIIVVICNSRDIKGIEEDCLFVEQLENSNDNLLDKVAYAEDEAYNLYNNYALQTGFSIRKGKPRYFNGTKNIRQREFLCSKGGFKIDEDPCEEKNWKKLETRTGLNHFKLKKFYL